MFKVRGVTLIELMVSLTILGIILTGAIDKIGTLVINAKIRSVSEDIKNGLMQAKIEAITRNSAIDFKPKESNWAKGWIIWIPKNFTDTGLSDVVVRNNSIDFSLTIQAKDSNGSEVSNVRFIGSGRVSLDGGTTISYPVTYKLTGSNYNCDTSSGITCLNVVVTNGGVVTVCNPNATGLLGC